MKKKIKLYLYYHFNNTPIASDLNVEVMSTMFVSIFYFQNVPPNSPKYTKLPKISNQTHPTEFLNNSPRQLLCRLETFSKLIIISSTHFLGRKKKRWKERSQDPPEITNGKLVPELLQPARWRDPFRKTGKIESKLQAPASAPPHLRRTFLL